MKASTWQWPTRNGLPPMGALIAITVLAAALWLTAPIVEVSISRLFGSIGRMAEFSAQMFHGFSWSYLPKMLSGLLETIEMTVLATAIAVVISLPLGVLAAKNATPHPIVYRLTRDMLSLMRALPELVWALVFVSAVGLGPLPGIMALAFVTVGFMAKFFAEGFEVIDHKAVEGVHAHGANWLQVRCYAMLPQAMPDLVGTVMYILDHNLRAATILGLVGAGGIGYDMVMAMRLFQYDRLVLIGLGIYIVVTVLDRLSDRLRARLIHGGRA